MAKVKSIFVCGQCGYESAKWNGKCPSCGAWNSFEEVETTVSKKSVSVSKKSADVSDKILCINEIEAADNEVRYKTGLNELDRVLGGGLVKGSVVLLSGEPGIGKSTILLQICRFLGGNHTILYISGEESVRQIKLRAGRLGVESENLYLLALTDAETVCDAIVENKPDIVIVDSIQTMSIRDISSAP